MRKKVKRLPVCRQMAKRKLFDDKMQCACIMAAVILTTVLLTITFSAAFYFGRSIRSAQTAAVGWRAHAAVSDVTDEQYDKMRKSSLTADISCYLHLGYLTESRQDSVVELGYYEDQMASWMGRSPAQGRMPKEADEIVLSSRFLKMKGIASFEEGMRMHLQYSVNGVLHEGDFTVCGVYEFCGPLAETAFISMEFYEDAVKGASGQEKMESAFGMRVVEVMFPDTRHLERDTRKLLEEAGAVENNWILNQAYGRMGTDLAVMFAAAFAMLLIMFCGYLIIYNIYYISVMQDMRFYGLLATLGFLEDEIRQVVKYKTNFICGAAIPIGLAAGFLFSKAVLPLIWMPFEMGEAQVRPNLALFVFAAFFSYVTVCISSRRPARMAAGMSPIAAKRYVPKLVKKKAGKGTRNGYKMHVMAWRNIVQERKKMILICCSLSLCMILASVFDTISHGVSMERFLEDVAVSDFIIGSSQYFNRVDSDFAPLDSSLVEEVCNWDGIQASGGAHAAALSVQADGEASKRYLELAKEFGWEEENYADGTVTTWVYGLDDYISHQMTLIAGELDWEKFASGNYVITNTLVEAGISYYKPGDKVKLDAGGGKEYTVLAVAQLPYDYTVRSQYVGSVDLYLPSQEWIKHMQSKEYYLYAYDVEDALETVWEGRLSNLSKAEGSDISYESKAVYRNQFEQFFLGIFLLGFAVSMVLGAVGLLNFVNVIYSSIYERRRELAVMQSMGMSKKQVYGMLAAESGYYMAFSWLAGTAVSLPLGYYVVAALGRDMKFFQYQCTVMPYAAFGIGGCLLAVCVPCLIFYALDKREGLLYRLQKRGI